MGNKILLLFMLLLSFYSKAANLDTISTCKVYYNDSLVKSVTFEKDNLIIIRKSKYKIGDYLAIQYVDDTPCKNCKYNIVVRGEGKTEIFNHKFTGKNKLIKIDLKDIINFRSTTNNSQFVLFFYGLNEKNKNNGIRLLRFQID